MQIKAAIDIPVSVVGAMTFEAADRAIAEGKLDMVAFARQLIADPDCINKLERDEEDKIRPCIRCNQCISREHDDLKPLRCSVNPLAAREADYVYLPPIKKAKKIVVVGGGPAGLEAARTLAERGHSVVLYEKSAQLGGLLRPASMAPFKTDLKAYLNWSIRSVLDDDRIQVHVATEATPERIKAENPDALIIAVGSKPISPKLSCTEKITSLWG